MRLYFSVSRMEFDVKLVVKCVSCNLFSLFFWGGKLYPKKSQELPPNFCWMLSLANKNINVLFFISMFDSVLIVRSHTSAADLWVSGCQTCAEDGIFVPAFS